jgi:hypothetical protein
MNKFTLIKKGLDITISFGCRHIGEKICGYKNGCEKNIFLGNIKQDGKIIIPITVFNNFDGLKLGDEKIELIGS